MFSIHLWRVVLLAIIVYTVNSSYRKVKDGINVRSDMRFMVYLTKAETSDQKYDAWICGGAIVSKDFIVTSAACVEDVKYMYAIAGYKTYVQNIATDACIKASKKKIVFSCVPRTYTYDYKKIEKWAFIDIAVVKVESPYNFQAAKVKDCSYAPNMIDINYDEKHQAPGTDAMILGWGHTSKFRMPDDKVDYNQKNLQYSSILIMDKKTCKNIYSNSSVKELIPVIDKYMICTMYNGNIDDLGDTINKTVLSAVDGCGPGLLRVGGECQNPNRPTKALSREENSPGIQQYSNPYESFPIASPSAIIPNKYYESSNTDHHAQSQTGDEATILSFEDIILNLRRSDGNETNKHRTWNYTRKAGICQNDHGGPLVTWVGRNMRLIGVASVFRLDKGHSCIGPYLFTSTQCNGHFLYCVINNSTRRDDYCDLSAEQKGFDIIQRRISWRYHPDGPAENELSEDLIERPSRPIG